MQINNIDGLILPKKGDEEFLKINFDSLFSYDFAKTEVYEFDIVGLETVIDEEKYQSVLFDITRSLDNQQKLITINKNIAEPIFLIHKLKEDETVYTNSLKIKVAKDIKATIVEIFVNSCTNSFYGVNRKIELEENASLEYAKIQDINASNSIIFTTAIEQQNSSNLEITNFEYGNGFVVNSFENIINAQNTNYELNALVKLFGDSTTSNLVKTIHNEKSSVSNINYKHSLKDSSKAVFKAKSIVNETALFSKAFQNCNTILLSDDAVIFAQPHLEIYIDELEASHGTTTGTLNKEQLLYLQSRGISKEESYEILLSAFENKIVDNIKDELIKEFIKTYKRDKYV